MFSLRVLALLALLVPAVACGSDDPSPSPTSPSPTSPSPTPIATPTPNGASSSVSIPIGAEVLGNRAYNPAEISIEVGGTITWVNTDRVSHTSTSDAAGWNSGIIGAGQQFSFAFPTAGTFPYHCAIHPGMVGTVVVR